MPPRELHVLGIDPGGTTGWAHIIIPRACITQDDRAHISAFEHGEVTGPTWEQSHDIARLAREIQSLSYRIGPAIIVESWEQDPSFKSTDPETLSPHAIGSQLLYIANRTNLLGDARLLFQSRTMAKSTATDQRLQTWRLYTRRGDHIRDATRHAITAIRRARISPEFAADMWNLSGND